MTCHVLAVMTPSYLRWRMSFWHMQQLDEITVPDGLGLEITAFEPHNKVNPGCFIQGSEQRDWLLPIHELHSGYDAHVLQ